MGKQKKLAWLAAVCCACMVTAACMIPYMPAVVFKKEDSDDVMAFLPLQKEKTFDIIYTHSIHKTKVAETYVWENGVIRQTALVYHDPAVGMPANAEQGEKLIITDGTYTLSNMKRTFPYIDMRIGRVRANHRLKYKGKEYELKRYIPPGSWTRMSVQKINVLQQLKGVEING
ncbi:DUF1850 domain-containing protein [Bacillus sonorensis]|uniref:DUF1850 domain-containing protein n=2 Tax=Bacillus sonorensis TaxID=119858 RepID=M5P5P2_9BACI|nr:MULTISPECIES: DUF1850 domain-containing protein [Bacillus]TWK76015.1 hypothetical protein CHCC20335_3780 [Bacillus paralicheniformis]ASB88551.1 hypothetical protein S101395_02043 [Bacillus sonorensis]EME74763.1 hypothetical protein BSONL12_07217 [Bacillus sonorensis L12]MBG9915623.1 RocC [Bacillus sonorensis]MCF7617907.1 DUF1850 domain-containing protein [Bacillus sonorensis]